MEVTLALSTLSVWKYPLFLLKLYFCTKDKLESHADFMGWGRGGALFFRRMCLRIFLPAKFPIIFKSCTSFLFFFLECLSFLLNKLSALIMEKSENR